MPLILLTANPIWDALYPYIIRLGFGGVAGLCVGYLFKKTLKLAAIIVGIVFVSIQVLVYLGYIGDVRWDLMSRDFGLIFHASPIYQSAWMLLSENFPFMGGMVVGFIMGLKAG